MRHAPATAGFSLVELMIVVAIIGILAAIGIPNYISMQLKAKRSEVPVSVDGIRTCEQAYNSAFDAFVKTPVSPRADDRLDKKMMDWVPATEWSDIGYFPTGAVRGNYQVQTTDTDFIVIGHCDVDNDDELAVYTASTDMEGALAGPNVF